MLPRIRALAARSHSMPAHGAHALLGVLATLLLVTAVTAAPLAQAADSGYTLSTWTGVVAGAPVPGANLPPAPKPGNPANVPQGQYDAAPAYQGQQICDPTPKPGTQHLADLIKATYGANQTVWIPRACNIGAQSEHKEGRALDWMTSVRDAQGEANAESFLNWLLGPDQYGVAYGNAIRLGVMYIGWNSRIWRGYEPGKGWAELKGCFSKPNPGDDTTCHRNHIHISLTWDGAAGTTSFWTGHPINVPDCPRKTSAATDPNVGIAATMTPVAPFISLDTSTGTGVAARCRLEQDEYAGDSHRLFPKVAGVGGVPADAAAVSVHLTVLNSNAPASLRVWTPGDTTSKVALSVPIDGGGTADAIVPVASDGTIALATTTGAMDVQVQVNGYYAAGAAGAGSSPQISNVVTSGGAPPPASPLVAPTVGANPDPAPESTTGSSSSPSTAPTPTPSASAAAVEASFNAVGTGLAYDSTAGGGPLPPGGTRTVTLAGLPAAATCALVLLTTTNAPKSGSVLLSRSQSIGPVTRFVFPKQRSRSAVMLVPVANSQLTLATSKHSGVDIKLNLLGYGTSSSPPTAIGRPAVNLLRGVWDPAVAKAVVLAHKFGLPGQRKLKAVLLRIITHQATTPGGVTVTAQGAAPSATPVAPIAAGASTSTIVLVPTGSLGQITLSASTKARIRVDLIGYVR